LIRGLRLDARTRGYIESMIDDITERGNVRDILEWVEQEVPLSSFRDLALGYLIGGVTTGASIMLSVGKLGIAISDEDKYEIRAIIKRRLPEFIQKITNELNK
jgi:hypothetical protein